jgi:hypothetical protein
LTETNNNSVNITNTEESTLNQVTTDAKKNVVGEGGKYGSTHTTSQYKPDVNEKNQKT